jgi:hypothetical protein
VNSLGTESEFWEETIANLPLLEPQLPILPKLLTMKVP